MVHGERTCAGWCAIANQQQASSLRDAARDARLLGDNGEAVTLVEAKVALPHPSNLNKTSIKPAVYGEPFIKRRGLFFLAVASRHGVVKGCVVRLGHDRSAVH
ncbi:hypothetical protein [Bradyrhizobium sp.]|uniref:hypothetical protein n=1 Tax=Bradyrhizobium sp. TaxID=376 RepID=UPI0025BB233E|nr:hypothetical protein [Bradyrhizobium sp.]